MARGRRSAGRARHGSRLPARAECHHARRPAARRQETTVLSCRHDTGCPAPALRGWVGGASHPWRARSAEGEQPRSPGARIAARGAVAAAAAVADAHVALTALVHAVDEFLSTAGEPVGATDLVRRQSATLGLVLAEIAEIVIGLDLVLQLAGRQLDHHRVVEETEHLH